MITYKNFYDSSATYTKIVNKTPYQVFIDEGLIILHSYKLTDEEIADYEEKI